MYSRLHELKEVTLEPGKRQYEMEVAGKKSLMLISDMALFWDPEYKKHIDFYNKNRCRGDSDKRAETLGTTF